MNQPFGKYEHPNDKLSPAKKLDCMDKNNF